MELSWFCCRGCRAAGLCCACCSGRRKASLCKYDERVQQRLCWGMKRNLCVSGCLRRALLNDQLLSEELHYQSAPLISSALCCVCWVLWRILDSAALIVVVLGSAVAYALVIGMPVCVRAPRSVHGQHLLSPLSPPTSPLSPLPALLCVPDGNFPSS